MRNRTVSARAFSAVIATELMLIGLAGWIAAGVPGLRRDTAAPSVTIQFAPPAAPVAPVRAYRI